MSGIPSLSDRVLVVGPPHPEATAWAGHEVSVQSQVSFADLNAEVLARVRPDTVVSALFSAECDIIDVAKVLTRLGYRGKLVALAPKLPNPRLIVAELRAVNPDLAVEVVEVSQQARPDGHPAAPDPA